MAQLVKALRYKVAGSIPDDVTGFFHWHNSFDRPMALGSNQPLFPGSKGGWWVGLTILPPSRNLEPSEHVQACTGRTLALPVKHTCVSNPHPHFTYQIPFPLAWSFFRHKKNWRPRISCLRPWLKKRNCLRQLTHPYKRTVRKALYHLNYVL